MKNRLTVKKAAKIMGVSEQFIRLGLQQQVFSWGYAVKTSSHYTYYINADLFYKFIENGIDRKNLIPCNMFIPVSN